MVSILKLETTNKNREGCDSREDRAEMGGRARSCYTGRGTRAAMLIINARSKGGPFAVSGRWFPPGRLFFVCGRCRCGCDGVVQ